MMERLFIVPVFVLLGTMLPWADWAGLIQSQPAALWLGLPIMIILRRLPALLVLRPAIPEFSRRDAIFAGWFGPIGVAALFYATLVLIEYPGHEQTWAIVSLAVTISTIVFALSAYPGTKWGYGEGKDART